MPKLIPGPRLHDAFSFRTESYRFHLWEWSNFLLVEFVRVVFLGWPESSRRMGLSFYIFLYSLSPTFVFSYDGSLEIIGWLIDARCEGNCARIQWTKYRHLDSDALFASYAVYECMCFILVFGCINLRLCSKCLVLYARTCTVIKNKSATKCKCKKLQRSTRCLLETWELVKRQGCLIHK